MGLETVVQNILDKGKAEASQIVAEAQREGERILSEVKSRGQRFIDENIAEAKLLAEKQRIQELARAELESRKIALMAQKEVLDGVHDRTLRHLESVPGKEELIKALVERNRAEIDQGLVYCSEKDVPTVKALVGERFAGPVNCIGGIIIESSDGTRRIDLRFETILKELWDDSVKEIADILWRRR